MLDLSHVVGNEDLLDSHPFVQSWPSHEVPCDLGGMDEPCGNAAKWIMRLAPCCVGAIAPRLACDSCKDARMNSELGVACADCGHVTEPARHAYEMVEAL